MSNISITKSPPEYKVSNFTQHYYFSGRYAEKRAELFKLLCCELDGESKHQLYAFNALLNDRIVGYSDGELFAFMRQVGAIAGPVPGPVPVPTPGLNECNSAMMVRYYAGRKIRRKGWGKGEYVKVLSELSNFFRAINWATDQDGDYYNASPRLMVKEYPWEFAPEDEPNNTSIIS